MIEAETDQAGQKRLFFSPDMYRKYIKPRQILKLFQFMKARTDAKLFYHCDGGAGAHPLGSA